MPKFRYYNPLTMRNAKYSVNCYMKVIKAW